MSDNVRLVGALDDVHGRTVAVYQDHDGVRLDTAGVEIMFSRAGAGRLIGLLEAADADAGEYALEAAGADTGAWAREANEQIEAAGRAIRQIRAILGGDTDDE